MLQSKKGTFSKILFITRKYRLEPKHSNSIDAFLKDLITSSLITILIYFTLCFLIYVLINFNLFTDPSQQIQYSNLCLSEEKIESNDLKKLNDKILSFPLDEKKKIFLCYRSLIYILKLNVRTYDKNFLDLCIYDSNTTAHDIKQNIRYTLGYSDLEIFWSELAKHDRQFKFQFNCFFGYYKFSYRSAEIYLYLFIKAPSTRLEFESVTRSGILYTQFDHVLKKFSTSLKELDQKKKISLLNRIPSYMIDEMVYKINISNNFVYLPVDPFNTLMYFYPNLWHLSSGLSTKCIF